MIGELQRARIVNSVLAKLGSARALEASETHNPPIPSQWGVWHDGLPVVGVDWHHGKIRARIRFTDALSGKDVRITLIRTEYLNEAVWAYRVAHVALWGSASWACNDDILDCLKSKG